MSRTRKPSTRPAASEDRGDARRLGGWLAAGLPHLGAVTALALALIVIAFVLSGPHIGETANQTLGAGVWTDPATWAALLYRTGVTTLTFLPAVVAAYVAHGVAGRPALLPGLLGGVASLGTEGGLLVGLLAGLLVGAVTLLLNRLTVPRVLRRATSMLFPLITTVVTAGAIFGIGVVVLRSVSDWLHGELVDLQFQHPVGLGAVLGLAVCADLGGVIAKAAISFGAEQLSGPDPAQFSPVYMTIMAAIVAAGMVPPLALSLATAVRSRLFTESERNYGKVSWLLGAAFLPEGAAPFVLADPVRVIPAVMAGGAVSGALVMEFGARVSYPFGGAFAFREMSSPLLFLAAVAAGVLTAAALTVGLKSLRRNPAA
ncbi:fructose-specific PTS transporter subunit EIIC [Lentzea sp. NPDC004782]|uniref:fructose-specific PTS transporter subunit EIIC n=1 Tax=Lentzea sp. NPDC004782 TaxID=3154458 RepID=UPI0033BA8460